MKRLLVCLLLLALPLPGSGKEDPITALVSDLSATHGLWVNGVSPRIDLPRAATSAEVLDKMFKSISFDNGRVTTYKILEQRDVSIPPAPDETYHAVLLQSDQGEWIILMRYQGESLGWWTKTFRPGQEFGP